MLYNTFESLETIDGVESVDSEYNQHPLFDDEITIFFKSGYRLISSKSLLGQTIELTPFNDELENAPTLVAQIYHDIGLGFSAKNDIYQLQNGKQETIDVAEFSKSITQIIGNEIMNFLKERHKSIPFKSLNVPDLRSALKKGFSPNN